MKKINIITLIALSSAAIMAITTLSACKNDGESDPSNSQSQSQSVSLTPESELSNAPVADNNGDDEENNKDGNGETNENDDSGYGTDDIPELTLPDKSVALKDEIISCAKNDSNNLIYSANICFTVPYGAENEKRTVAEDGNNWTKVKVGDKVGDFTVSDASSGYQLTENADNAQIIEQKLALNGSLAFTAEAEYVSAPNGDIQTDQIVLYLDKGSREKLVSLTPSSKSSPRTDEELADEKTAFYISDSDEHFKELADMLKESETAAVKIETDDFYLRFTEFGLVTDGTTVGGFNNIMSITAA